MSTKISDIEELLGNDARKLLDHSCEGISKEALYAPGPDFVDRVFAESDRPVPVLRNYQQEAADIFHAGGQKHGGSGVIVLPCGAGKTMVGMAAMAQTQCATLILTPSTVAARQWKAELLDKTDLREEAARRSG